MTRSDHQLLPSLCHRRHRTASIIGRGRRPDSDARRARTARGPLWGATGKNCAARFEEISTRSSPKRAEEERRERYTSVTAFADDLRRFLRHERISARPDTARYRATRFVRRHVGGVAAAAVILLMFGGFTFRLATERDCAQREAAKAAKVSEALTALLMGVDPIENPVNVVLTYYLVIRPITAPSACKMSLWLSQTPRPRF